MGGLNWMLVIPAGQIDIRDGRKPLITGDAEALQAIIDNTLAWYGETEVMVDYDHLAISAGSNGTTAKAAGWVKRLEVRPSGIWAGIKWTEAAALSIKSEEYRYLSPWVAHDSTRRVIRIKNIALVNMPAADLEAVALRAQQEETQMKTFMQKLAAKLGLKDDASEEAILAAIGKTGSGKDEAAMKAETEAAVSEALSTALAPIARAAGLTGAATPEEVAETVTALADGKGADGGDSEKLTALQNDLTSLTKEHNELLSSVRKEKATGIVDAAIAEGRVIPKSLRDHYITRHAKGGDEALAVEKEIAAMPKIGGGNTILPSTPPQNEDGSVALSAEQLEAAEALGIAPSDYAKTIEQEQSARR